MSIKNISDLLSKETDACFYGDDIPDELGYQEGRELMEFGRSLYIQDFSEGSSKEAVMKKVKDNLETKGDNIMNRTGKIRRVTVTAASLVLVLVALMQTTFAQELLEKVKKSISLGNIKAIQVEHPRQDEYPLPDKLKGKIFDKNGKALDSIKEENAGDLYTAEGEKIVDFLNGEVITETQKVKMAQEGKLVVKDSGKLNDYTCFKVVMPDYIPEGYKFERAEFYKDNEGNVSRTKYIDLYFTNAANGNYIFMQQRASDKETAYEVSTDGELEKIKINGVDAVLIDGRTIGWEYNDVLYDLSGKEGHLGKSELIKIAESIK